LDVALRMGSLGDPTFMAIASGLRHLLATPGPFERDGPSMNTHCA
jgi:hypothetical protein